MGHRVPSAMPERESRASHEAGTSYAPCPVLDTEVAVAVDHGDLSGGARWWDQTRPGLQQNRAYQDGGGL